MIYDVDNDKELTKVLAEAKSGDTIHFGAGERYAGFTITTPGLRLDGDGAEIRGGGVNGIAIAAHHTNVTGFDISGFMRGIAVQNTYAISISQNHTHHNNRIGIYANRSDYLTIRDNESDHNGGPWGGAGISVHIPQKFKVAGNNPTPIKILYNHTHDNFNDRTEGWGIILDGKYAEPGLNFAPYFDRVLVAWNTTEGNEKAGFHSFGFYNVAVVDNTFFDAIWLRYTTVSLTSNTLHAAPHIVESPNLTWIDNDFLF